MEIKKNKLKLTEEEIKKNRDIVLDYINPKDVAKKTDDLTLKIKENKIAAEIKQTMPEIKIKPEIKIIDQPEEIIAKPEKIKPAVKKTRKTVKPKSAKTKKETAQVVLPSIAVPEIKIGKEKLVSIENAKREEEKIKFIDNKIEEESRLRHKKILHLIKHEGYSGTVLREFGKYLIIILAFIFIFYLTFFYNNNIF